MLINFKSWIAVGVVASLFVLPAFVQGPTGVNQAQDPAYRTAVINFSVLSYANPKGEMVKVMASTITKLWLLTSPRGEMRLEILYENGDYSMIQVTNMDFIRRMPGATAVNVPIVRSGMEGMAFPELPVK